FGQFDAFEDAQVGAANDAMPRPRRFAQPVYPFEDQSDRKHGVVLNTMAIQKRICVTIYQDVGHNRLRIGNSPGLARSDEYFGWRAGRLLQFTNEGGTSGVQGNQADAALPEMTG